MISVFKRSPSFAEVASSYQKPSLVRNQRVGCDDVVEGGGKEEEEYDAISSLTIRTAFALTVKAYRGY